LPVRDARAEAADRVGGRWDVRVLEPSPPAVPEAPWFADDPVAGGEVVPVERPGARSWRRLCQEEGDADLLAWCHDRWLVPRPLDPLPPGFAATRRALHRVAEERLAPARQAVNGKIGLRYTWHGFGTPFFGPDRQLRVEDGLLVGDGDGDDDGEDLGVDRAAARALGDWFGFATSLLEQLRAEADDASRVQLWPEHFDVSVDLGPAPVRANYGGSPGDDDHPEPYLYVGPWEAAARTGPFWNEPFGASLGHADILAGADPLAFLREGRDRLLRF
jgi:hypothetical protein